MPSPNSRVMPSGPLRTRSLRRRVTVAVLGLLALMLAILGITVDLVLRERLEGDLEQRLLDRAATAQALVGQMEGAELVRRLEGQGVSVALQSPDGQVVTAGPAPVVSQSTTQAPPMPRRAGPRGGPGGGPAEAGPGPGHDLTRSGDQLQVDAALSDGSQLLLSADAGDVRRTLTQVRWVILASAAGVLLLAGFVLVPLVTRLLAPLDHMTATARSITAGDRGRRLRPDLPHTELGRTATAFDDMLDAVEGAERQARAAETGVRGFLSDAAHELRTPLTGVQAAAERLVRTDLSRPEREQLAVSIVRETRRAGRLVNDMLAMTRIDQGLDLHRTTVDLLAMANSAAERRRLTGPDLRLRVFGRAITSWVDPDRLTQVLDNLLDNAARAAGPSGRIRLDVGTEGDDAVIDVRDNGPGVPTGDAERIFDRLVRLDAARARDTGGAGLGLSIARGIARAHGGDLTCMPAAKGAWFRLRLPVIRTSGVI